MFYFDKSHYLFSLGTVSSQNPRMARVCYKQLRVWC